MKKLTKRYEELIKGYGVNTWGAKDFDSKEFAKVLTSIKNIAVGSGSLKGGGNDECRIKTCYVWSKEVFFQTNHSASFVELIRTSFLSQICRTACSKKYVLKARIDNAKATATKTVTLRFTNSPIMLFLLVR